MNMSTLLEGVLNAFSGLGRRVVSAAFSSDDLVCSLCTGEVVQVSLDQYKKEGRNSIGIGEISLSCNYAGVTKVIAAEDRIFVLSREFVPGLPHGDHYATGSLVLGSRTKLEVEASDSEESEKNDEGCHQEVGTVLSLQELCDNEIARQVSVKSVGGIIAIAKYLRRFELLAFCNDFVLR